MNIYKLFRTSDTMRRFDRVDSYVAIASTAEEAMFSHSIRLQVFQHCNNGVEYDESKYLELESTIGITGMPLTPEEGMHYQIQPHTWEVTLIGTADPGITDPQLVCMDYEKP